MLGAFVPKFSGRYAPATLSPTLLRDLAARIRAGELLPHAPPSRNRYVVTRETSTSLRFVAEGLLTNAAVGINDVRLELDPREAGALRYEVSYGGWTRFVVGLSLAIIVATLVIIVVAMAVVPESGSVPTELHGFLWPMAIFWGVLWPWILVAMHKPMARRVFLALIEHANGGEEPALAFPSKWQSRHRQSQTVIAGWPLWVIAMGPNRERGTLRGVARGWIAIGDVAFGALAIGGVAVGGISIGGLSIGLLAVGGAAIGGVAFGGAAIGGIAFGGLAIGYYAVGGGAFGVHAVGGAAQTL